MKKFFGKYDLVKVSGIMVLLTVILTWLIPQGYFSGSEMVVDEITRIGIMDFFQYGLLGMYYFTVLITFLFVLGGFYQVLSKRAGYQKLIKSISESLKESETLFVLIVMLVFAILGSMTVEYFPVLAFIPFIITILNRLKVDKVSAFNATFGGLLAGTLGTTYSTKVASQIASTFPNAGDQIVAQVILLVLSYLLLAVFTVLRMKKTKKENFEEYDKFELTTLASTKKAPKAWPYAVGAIIFAIVTVLAYLPWSTWNIQVFEEITTWVNGISIGDIPIVKYIFGEFQPFGTWDIFQVQFIMLFIMVLINWFGKMSFEEMCECIGEGFKKMGNVVVVFLIVYAVLIMSVMFPVVPTIVDYLATLTKGFNGIIAYLCASISALFGVEMQYAISMSGTYFASIFSDKQSALYQIFQSAYGIVGFVAPTSAILMLGLSYLGITYKDWMKHIWKYVLIMLAISAIIILIIA